jgi:hypothetical protein
MMLQRITLICCVLLASSCALLKEKASEDSILRERQSAANLIGMRNAVIDLQGTFDITEYGRDSQIYEMKGEPYYSLWGTTLYSDNSGIIMAFPSQAVDKSVLLSEAAKVNTSLESKEMKEYSGVRFILTKGQELYVFYIDNELQQKLESGKVIQFMPKEDFTEEEFRKEFPQGERAAYTIIRELDGRYTLKLQSQKEGTPISPTEAEEYIKKNGQPWTFERTDSFDRKTGKKLAHYIVERNVVNFKAAEFPLVKLIRDSSEDVLAISRVDVAGEGEFIDNADKVSNLVEKLLEDETKYEFDP